MFLRMVPLGFEQITDLSAAVGLTVPEGATCAVFNPETAGVRWRDDGTGPTASVGMLIVTDTFYEYTGTLRQIEFIAASGSPKLNVSYYKQVG